MLGAMNAGEVTDMSADPSASAPASGNGGVYFKSLAELERTTIEARLIAFDGNKAEAAKSLGISLKTLYNRLNAYAADKAGGNGR